MSLDGAAVNASKLGLAIAMTYANQRRQFAGASRHRRGRPPRLRRAPAPPAPAARRDVRRRLRARGLLATFDAVFSGRRATPRGRARTSRRMAAALKPTSTWHALTTLQEAREACGGAGFLAENRLTGAARRPRRVRDVRGRQHRPAAARRQAPARRLRQVVQGRRRRRRWRASWPGAPRTRRCTARRCVRVVQTIADGGDPRRSAGQLRTPRRSASCSRTASRRWSRRSRRRCGRRRRPTARRGRRACSTPTSTSCSSARGRRPSWCSGRRSPPALEQVDRPGHPAGAHLAPGPVRADPRSSGTSPGTCINGRLSARPRPHGDVVHRPAARPGCARTRRTSSTRSATSRRTCAPRSPRAPRRRARTRPARTTGRSVRPATPRPGEAPALTLRQFLREARRVVAIQPRSAEEERHQDHDPRGRPNW